MVLSAVFNARKGSGVLAAIYVAQRAGAPMVDQDAVEVVAGRGLAGDRYAEDKGFYRATDACQVTVIDGEALARIEQRSGVRLTHGEHRRNLVVQGIVLSDLRGARVQIGSVLFEYVRPRPPCAYLESITQRGIARALRKHFGVCLRALQSGVIRVGDAVRVEQGRGQVSRRS
jgi:MOSC domain-containing protein YiiM